MNGEPLETFKAPLDQALARLRTGRSGPDSIRTKLLGEFLSRVFSQLEDSRTLLGKEVEVSYWCSSSSTDNVTQQHHWWCVRGVTLPVEGALPPDAQSFILGYSRKMPFYGNRVDREGFVIGYDE